MEAEVEKGFSLKKILRRQRRRVFLREGLILLGIVAPLGILGGLGFSWVEQRFRWDPGTVRIVLTSVMGLLGLCGAYFLYRYARALGEGDGILSIRGARKHDRAPTGHLTIDDVGITRTAQELREHVAWVDIARVRIMTTDQGPYQEDVFFVVDSKNGEGCIVPHDLAVRSGLLEALQSRLAGVNSAAVIEAMGSSENRVFTIWEGPRHRERRLLP